MSEIAVDSGSVSAHSEINWFAQSFLQKIIGLIVLFGPDRPIIKA